MFRYKDMEVISVLKAIVLGSGGALPDADRNPPGYAVVTSTDTLLFDCGGTTSSLMQAKINPSSLSYLFLTHLHIDHCVEFPSLIFSSYMTGKKDEWFVFGPKGTQAFSDGIFNVVYPFARQSARDLRNVEIQIQVREVAPDTMVETELINNGSWRVSAIGVKHSIDTLAYRVETKEGSVVISGDTEPCANLIQIARKADLLIQDCSWPDEMGEGAGHCIPRQVREIVKAAQVNKVALVHLFPSCRGYEDEMIRSVRQEFEGEVILGEDLLEVSIA